MDGMRYVSARDHTPHPTGDPNLAPRGSKYPVIKDLGPESHDNHGL